MTRLLLALAVLFLQGTPEHPWPNHEPPPDYFCVAAMNTKAVKTDVHACGCLGMVMDPVCSSPDANAARQNSGACKSWCKPRQCRCGVQCRKDT